MSDNSELRLSNTGIDRIAAATRGGIGAIPFVGAIAAEIVNSIIPNQRLDRIAKVLELLSAKVRDVEQEQIAATMRQEEMVDLFEDTLIQASRALTDERRERLAAFMKNALVKEELEHQYRKRLLQLLAELNDVELLLLATYDMTWNQARDFHELHAGVLRGPRATMASSKEEREQAAVHDSYTSHMVQLGLLAPRFEPVPRGSLGVPEFDQGTGMMKASGHHATTLGRLLLASVDLPGPEFSGAAT